MSRLCWASRSQRGVLKNLIYNKHAIVKHPPFEHEETGDGVEDLDEMKLSKMKLLFRNFPS